MVLVTPVLVAEEELDTDRKKYTSVSRFLHVQIDKNHYEKQSEPQ
jgi:hypothetical protein